MPKSRLASILIEEGLIKKAGIAISPKVGEPTPVMQEIMAAAEKLWPYGLRLMKNFNGISLDKYIEGYVESTVYGRVSVMPSVGGDYDIPYKETEDRTETLRAMISMSVAFLDDGSLVVQISQPSSPVSRHGNFAHAKSVDKVLYAGKSVSSAIRAMKTAKSRFDYWEAKFV